MYSILTDHATVTHKDNIIAILAHPDAKLMVNGKPARDETKINHNDRFFFVFVFVLFLVGFLLHCKTSDKSLQLEQHTEESVRCNTMFLHIKPCVNGRNIVNQQLRTLLMLHVT